MAQIHAHNNRPGGYGWQLDEKMEMLPAFDQNRPSCPSWRRFGASVLLEDSQVTSAPLRPACALSLAERPMRKRPLGIQAGFTRPERWAQSLLERQKARAKTKTTIQAS